MPSTTVLTDKDKIVQAIKQFQANTGKIWCACVDSTLPAFSASTVKDGYIEAKRRGVRIMYITEVTKENFRYCKEIAKYAKLRHLDGVQGNFAVSETEYIAGVKRGDSIVRLVRSDMQELVRQQRYIFDMLWMQAAAVQNL